jgi:hypothetical protein
MGDDRRGVSAAADAARTLVELAEEELAHVRAGRLDALESIARRRDAAMAALGPAPDRVLLERALTLQGEVTAALQLALAGAERELTRLGRGRRALRGYAAGGAPPRLDAMG